MRLLLNQMVLLRTKTGFDKVSRIANISVQTFGLIEVNQHGVHRIQLKSQFYPNIFI